jgi:hypothetical protein
MVIFGIAAQACATWLASQFRRSFTFAWWKNRTCRGVPATIQRSQDCSGGLDEEMPVGLRLHGLEIDTVPRGLRGNENDRCQERGSGEEVRAIQFRHTL